MTNSELVKKDYILNIAEWNLYNYRKFEHEKPIKIKKWDTILWVCKEIMDVLGYWEFDKQTQQTKAYIVEEIIREKKADKTYIKFEQKLPIDMNDDE